ncbi:MAG: hypothetical protein KME25_17035 [Symplocastrum torsivum CPER-KK1]|uniref:Uncharacterized protein n=1 Tax=Symplocastrum torsivum CPER-KK1 TaxID=450513 RepID=A0A951UAQ8_9CYAN|nr:hypothetical protein [Symplocastrum torsivum CPER-KK1]
MRSLDYYLPSEHELLVIEAKNADLQRGFTQLGVELIAIDQWSPSLGGFAIALLVFFCCQSLYLQSKRFWKTYQPSPK